MPIIHVRILAAYSSGVSSTSPDPATAIRREALKLFAFCGVLHDCDSLAEDLLNALGSLASLEQRPSIRVIHREHATRYIIVKNKSPAELGDQHIAHGIARVSKATFQFSD